MKRLYTYSWHRATADGGGDRYLRASGRTALLQQVPVALFVEAEAASNVGYSQEDLRIVLDLQGMPANLKVGVEVKWRAWLRARARSTLYSMYDPRLNPPNPPPVPKAPKPTVWKWVRSLL